MSEILYIQTEKNVEVHNHQVYLQDVAKLACSDQKVLNRNRMRRVLTLPENETGRYVVSAVDLVRAVAKEEESVDVTHIGEANFVLSYEKKQQERAWISWLKTGLVCLLSFFGAAFSIMTFNTDVDTAGLFDQISRQLAGGASQGAQVLKFFYSLGIGVGVIFFFNHFGHGKITQDPTPIEVQMRTYEEDVDKALIAEHDRQESPEKKEGAKS